MPASRAALAAQLAVARAHPGPALVATVTGLVNGATMVAGATALAWSTDHLVVPALAGEQIPAGAWWLSVQLIMGISAVRWGTILERGVATGRVQYRAQAETRRAVVRRYLELDPAWHRRRSPGRLLAHAVSDVDALWSPTQWAYFALGMVFMLLLTLGELVRRDSVLGPAGLALVGAVLAVNVVNQRLLAPRARALQAARGVVAGIAHESIEGGPVVRGLGLTDGEDARFAPAVSRLREAALATARISSVFDPLLELLPSLAVLVVVAVSAQLTVGDLLRVLGALGLREWLTTLPEGLATPVGLRGERLSAGERRLAALARTAAADPDLIILDEATSSIDPATDAAVQRALAVLARGRTTITIAHRMVTAESADRVLVFADGRLVQCGTHGELLTRPGPYAGLVAAGRRHP